MEDVYCSLAQGHLKRKDIKIFKFYKIKHIEKMNSSPNDITITEGIWSLPEPTKVDHCVTISLLSWHSNIYSVIWFISTTQDYSVKRIDLQFPTLVGSPRSNLGSGPPSCTTTWYGKYISRYAHIFMLTL